MGHNVPFMTKYSTYTLYCGIYRFTDPENIYVDPFLIMIRGKIRILWQSWCIGVMAACLRIEAEMCISETK